MIQLFCLFYLLKLIGFDIHDRFLLSLSLSLSLLFLNV